MKRRSQRTELLLAAAPTLAAATVGNALIGRDALRWFRQELRHPPTLPPFPVFLAVGPAYYAILFLVLYRALHRDDARSVALALVVLALNELWNVAFFGRRSTRNGFLGMVVFSVPLAALQLAVARDRTSVMALTPYSLWVAYDLVWTYQLWRRNST